MPTVFRSSCRVAILLRSQRRDWIFGFCCSICSNVSLWFLGESDVDFLALENKNFEMENAKYLFDE